MPLRAGDRLGSFVIVAPLGAGGMGEVWRARSSELGREVALDHPTIATLHGLQLPNSPPMSHL